MRKFLTAALLVCCMCCVGNVKATDDVSDVTATVQAPVAKKVNIPRYLQDISVTIKSDRGQGSGVIVTREIAGEKVNFVWTAAHVVDGQRKVRSVIDPASGTTKQVVEFDDVGIVKELVEDGRRVGELKMDAKIVKFSNFQDGEDLALLEIRKKDFVNASAKFYLGDEIPQLGTHLIHVGSLHGQVGSNSMTTGIVSQIGRTVDNKIFDQTTVTAFPGSSGGGVFLEGDKDGGDNAAEYMGMLVRGAGETFNLIVPVRRIRTWAKSAGVEWAIDPNVPAPSSEERAKMKVEDVGVSFNGAKYDAAGKKPEEAPVLPNVKLSLFDSLMKLQDRHPDCRCAKGKCDCGASKKCGADLCEGK